MVDANWTDDSDVYDDEQQGLDDLDADSPEEILKASSGTAKVGGEVVNSQNAEDDGVEAESNGSHPRCDASEDDENTVQYANIPDELKDRDQWVCWKVEDRDGKPTKIPVDPHTGGNAKSNDDETWTSFENACDYYETHDDVEGVGFMFSRDGPYAGVDLDDCVDPDTKEVEEDWARDIVETLDSFTEYSPSDTGLHVIVRGIVPPDGNRRGNVEMYDEKRFFTVTGDVGMGAPKNVEKRVEELKDVHKEYIRDDEDGVDAGSDAGTSEPTDVDLDDEELVEKARNAENGDKFDRLWNGSTAGYPSQSEADEALCCLLAFWTGGDRERIDELFRQSGLMRPKWDEDRGDKTYGELTVDNALKQVDEYYEPSKGNGVDVDEILDDAGSAVSALSSWLSEYKKEEEKTPKKGEKTQKAADILLRYERFATVGEDETVYRYHTDGGVWRDDGESFVRSTLDAALRTEYSTRVFNETVERVKARTEIDRDEFRIPEGTVPVENGLLDLGTRELREYEPEDYATFKLPVEYDEDAEATRFRDYLETVTRSGSDRKKLQEYAGYILMHGQMPHHKALFLAGPQASGKSTFIDVISSLLPDDVVGASTPHQLTRRFGKMELYETWLNVSADIPSDMIDDTGTFKMLVGKDRVAAEIKGVQEKVKFTPTTKHVFSANQLPEIYDADDAFWRRILIVPFPETIPRDEREDDLDEKLVEEESSGVLNWILDGYDHLVEEGGFTADRNVEETRKKWMTWSTPVIRFYARCLRDEVGASEPVDDVYDAYKTFCEEEMGVTPVTKVKFGKRLTKFGHIGRENEGSTHSRESVYINIRLRDDLR